MNTTQFSQFEKIASLPAVQQAIRVQAEHDEAESLSARLGALEGYWHTLDELEALNDQNAEFDTKQTELDQQRDELNKQRAANLIKRQQAEGRHNTYASELRQNHGSGQAADIARMLEVRVFGLRREATYQRSLREKKVHWTGEPIEKPIADAMQKADELERRAEQFEHERDAIRALEFACLSPQAIERDIRARVEKLGLILNIGTVASGWRFDGWDSKPKTAAA